MNALDTTQPAAERDAIAYFKAIGREAVEQQYEALSKVANTRLRERVSDYGSVPVSFTAFDFLTEEERNLRHTLLLGIMLCIDEAAEARQRIAQRIAQRRARRAA